MLNIINDNDIKAIHETSLRILSETGIKISHSQAREILTGAGATINDNRVLIAPHVVEKALRTTQNTVSLCGQNGETITLGDGSLHWHNMGGGRDVFDPNINDRREATVEDVCQSTILMDAMEHVTSITAICTPQDVPAHLTTLAMYRHTLAHTSKVVLGPGINHAQEIAYIMRMAEVIGAASEILTLTVSPLSPLTFHNHVAETIIAAARQNIVLSPLPAPIAGATAPMSLAGALALQNAENLATIVLSQLVSPGAPMIYCGRLSIMDPRTAASIWGGVELGMVSAATVQIAHFYNLPVNIYGFSTNSYDYDIQNGYERMQNAMLPALAGADELSGIGQIGAGVMSSLAQIVLDNEIAASVKQARRGITVDADSLAFDVINEAATGKGDFISSQHTRRYTRNGEILLPRLAERKTWDGWDGDGRGGMVARAHAEAERILAQHQPEPLSREQETELDKILDSADDELSRI